MNRELISGMRLYIIVGEARQTKIQKGELEDKQKSLASFPEALA